MEAHSIMGTGFTDRRSAKSQSLGRADSSSFESIFRSPRASTVHPIRSPRARPPLPSTFLSAASRSPTIHEGTPSPTPWAMEGIQHSPHDDFVSTPSWSDYGSQVSHHGMHSSPHSPSHEQDFGNTYGFVHSPGFSPQESVFRIHQQPMTPNYMSVPQWGQSMPPPTPPVSAPPPHHSFPLPPPLAPAPPPINHHHMSTSAPSESVHPPPRTSSNPRRTLTDSDRRRMCIFHEENPNVKQTEIGAMFGVERSTVSKVLRQKEKYLFPDDGSRSPAKRTKGKFPDIERALSVWAKNTRKQGIALTDMMIREKAKFFATSVGISEAQFKQSSQSWLEKFKQKNNLHPNGRGRSESDATGLKRGLAASAAVAAATGAAMGDTSGANGATKLESTPEAQDEDEHGLKSPTLMQASKSQDSHPYIKKRDSPESTYMDFTSSFQAAFKHESSPRIRENSLHASDTRESSFSIGSPTSPFFSPDHSAQPSPGFAPPRSFPHQRPRSQTMPLPQDPLYISPPPSSEPWLTPKMHNQPIVNQPTLSSPVMSNSMGSPHMSNSMGSPHEGHTLVSPHDTPSSSHTQLSNGSTTPLAMNPSKEDARRGLEVVMAFLRQQPVGFVETDEYLMVGKLLGRFALNDQEASPQMEMSSIGGGGGLPSVAEHLEH